jgi:hypothetical protein
MYTQDYEAMAEVIRRLPRSLTNVDDPEVIRRVLAEEFATMLARRYVRKLDKPPFTTFDIPRFLQACGIEKG